MPGMHWGPPGFTYSACGLFIKNKKQLQKINEAGYLRHISQKELDKACF